MEDRGDVLEEQDVDEAQSFSDELEELNNEEQLAASEYYETLGARTAQQLRNFYDDLTVDALVLCSEPVQKVWATQKLRFRNLVFRGDLDGPDADEQKYREMMQKASELLRHGIFRIQKFVFCNIKDWQDCLVDALCSLLDEDRIDRLYFSLCDPLPDALCAKLLKLHEKPRLAKVSFESTLIPGAFANARVAYELKFRGPELLATPDVGAVDTENSVTAFVRGLDPATSRLRKLFCSQCDAYALLKFIWQSKTIRSLLIQNNALLDEIFKALTECEQGINVIALYFRQCLNDKDLAAYRTLVERKRIRSIRLGFFDDRMSQFLQTCHHFVRQLVLYQATVSTAPIVAFLKQSPQLRLLWFEEVDMEPSGVENVDPWALVFSAISPSLCRLYYSSYDAFSERETFMFLVTFVKRPALLELEWIIDGHFLNDDDVSLLADALSRNTTLENLHLLLSYFDAASLERVLDLTTRCSAKIFIHYTPPDGLLIQGTDEAFLNSNQRQMCVEGLSRKLALTLVALRKFRNNTTLNCLIRDLVVMIAKELYNSRYDGKSWWKDQTPEK